MTLIDDKKGNAMDILIKIKRVLINISISLAVYILIFIIGSLTMFACNVSEAQYLSTTCESNGIKLKTPDRSSNIKINSIFDDRIVSYFVKTKILDANDRVKQNVVTSTKTYKELQADLTNILNSNTHSNQHLDTLNTYKELNKVASQYNEIFEVLDNNILNDETLKYCVNKNENNFFSILTNNNKNTMNLIYSFIERYTIFLKDHFSEICILWISPFFSFFVFGFLILIVAIYFPFQLISSSIVNLWNNIWETVPSAFTLNGSNIIQNVKQIIISFFWILVSIIWLITGPIVTFFLILYSLFKILTQKLRKRQTSVPTSNNAPNYGIFQKMADNLIYKKGYNIFIILIICIINVFIFDTLIGGINFALIIIFYYIFYKKLTLYNVSTEKNTDFVSLYNFTTELARPPP
jgi:hypothetical protein